MATDFFLGPSINQSSIWRFTPKKSIYLYEEVAKNCHAFTAIGSSEKINVNLPI